MTELVHRFVTQVPEDLEDGIVYVSIPFSTVIHKCCCGCGHEVVTPLARSGWTLAFDGESISLDPSIGNRALPCRSHYWITKNRVRWVGWRDEEDAKTSSKPRGAKARSRTLLKGLSVTEAKHNAAGGALALSARLRRWLRRD